MKKRTLISGMVFILFVFISQGLYAQGYYRYGPPMEDDYYALNMTKEQMEKIDTLEHGLIKELSPLIAKIRSQSRISFFKCCDEARCHRKQNRFQYGAEE